MFWGKKEDKKTLPDLPPQYGAPGFVVKQREKGESMNTLQDNVQDELEPDNSSTQKQEFPSFPDSLNDKGFSQAAIKDAVADEPVFPEMPEKEEVEYIPESSKNFKTMEMEEWSPSIQKEPSYTLESSPTAPLIKSIPTAGSKPKARIFKESSSVQPLLKEPPVSVDYASELQKAPKNADIFVKLDKFYSARKSLADAQQKLEDMDELIRKIRETKLREEQELEGWEKELLNIKSRINDLNVNLFEKVD